MTYTDSMRAQDLAKARALEWMRARHRHVWQRILDEAYAELGVERRPVGRPRIPSPSRDASTSTHL